MVDVVSTLEGMPWRRAVVALVALAALGLAAGYGVSARARPESVAVSVKPSGSAPSASAGAGKQFTVHVAGAVLHAGLYSLPAGARIDDAVKAAGGAAPDADLDSLNLASRVRDGDKVVVPRRQAPGQQGGHGAQPAAHGGAEGADGRVNVNIASPAELEKLPGIGPALAQRIVAYREQHGGFRAVRDLLKVSGIGPRKFEAVKDLVTI